MHSLCIRCKGKGWCNQPCEILARFRDKAPKPKLHFSGSTPPEIFVGRVDYPNVFSGILAPEQKGDTTILSSPEEWFLNHLTIEQILEYRGQMVYGRNKMHIKSQQGKIKQITQELALSSKPVSTEFFLKKKPRIGINPSNVFSIMPSPAPIKKIILEENPHVEKKVDYIVSDYDVKATMALQELYKTNKITTTHLQKLLSAGLLGVKASRKMVPTRWSITAVDDTLGKQLLEKIRNYQEINQIQLFHHYYNGNHFEILLLPEMWSFEVIEVSVKGGIWNDTIFSKKNQESRDLFMQDYEGFFGRKTYAKNVVGAYYTDRLAVCEYLEKIKRQATVLVLHEERPEYYAPLGVGIIRESVRHAMSKKPETPATLSEAIFIMASRLKVPIWKYKKMSWVLGEYGKQRRLGEWF